MLNNDPIVKLTSLFDIQYSVFDIKKGPVLNRAFFIFFVLGLKYLKPYTHRPDIGTLAIIFIQFTKAAFVTQIGSDA